MSSVWMLENKVGAFWRGSKGRNRLRPHNQWVREPGKAKVFSSPSIAMRAYQSCYRNGMVVTVVKFKLERVG